MNLLDDVNYSQICRYIKTSYELNKKYYRMSYWESRKRVIKSLIDIYDNDELTDFYFTLQIKNSCIDDILFN